MQFVPETPLPQGHVCGDRRVVRLIQKWLRAGVEEEKLMVSEEGTPQGGSHAVVDGHIRSYGVPGNWVALRTFRQ